MAWDDYDIEDLWSHLPGVEFMTEEENREGMGWLGAAIDEMGGGMRLQDTDAWEAFVEWSGMDAGDFPWEEFDEWYSEQ